MAATAQQPIMDSLSALLENATTVTATVATRIYDSMAPQDVALPFVLVTIVTDPVIGFFNAIDDIELQFQVDVYGKLDSGNKGTRVIGDAVYAALHRQTATISGYSACSIMCTDRGRMDQDFISGQRVQQDAWRDTQFYTLYGYGG